MNSSKVIDVGASAALIELKAELHRKQDQLRSQTTERGVSKSLRVKNEPKGIAKLAAGKNANVEKRSQKDVEEDVVAAKTYERAKYVLEAKAKLYDDINAKALSFDEDHPVLTNSLVDFQRKAIDRIQEDKAETSQYRKLDEGKWTEFTDSLGRTRRVLKSDLAAYVAADKELCESGQAEEPTDTTLDELVRQEKREKWEQQAAELANKNKVHYQDILFDEIREHGTGYYGFSKDDDQRAIQLAQLKKLSEETAASRKKIETEKKGKKAQLKERLRKIKARQRAKAGLPPEEESEEEEDEAAEKDKLDEPEKKAEEDKNEEWSRPVDLRAWDFGKPGVYGPQPSSFDDLDAKWLKDRREDRKSEFAPPSSYALNSGSSSTKKYENFVKGGTKRSYEPIPASPFPQRVHPIQQDGLPGLVLPSNQEFERGRRTEIAPPPTYEYYHGDTKRQRTTIPKPASQEAVSEAFAQGIENFRKKFEEKLAKAGKDQYPGFD